MRPPRCRCVPAPGGPPGCAEDYRVKYIAARRRIVALEMQVAALLAAADRPRPHDDRICPHAQPLMQVRWQLADARREIEHLRARVAGWLEGLRGGRRPGPEAAPLMLPHFPQDQP